VRVRSIAGTAIFGSILATVLSVQPVMATTHSAKALWIPSTAPLPSLPDGPVPGPAVLNSTSCSSTSFCVAVGYVAGDGGHWPLVETYRGGFWTPSLVPLPQGYQNDGSGSTDGYLYSVSCGANGSCAAVGGYADPSGIEDGLLETLTDGTWTATGADEATASDGGVVGLQSVSCANATTCMAVGTFQARENPTVVALIYVLNAGSWQLQAQPPLPANYDVNLALASVSCPDANNCVVAGSYDDLNPSGVTLDSDGLILTDASGTWSDEEAPLPANADVQNQGSGLQVLDTVDCADANDCVAGGSYLDGANAGYSVPLLETLQSGIWTPTEAPTPAGGPANEGAWITGVTCPSVGACLADGIYAENETGAESGMLLSQVGTSWSAVPAPIPGSPSGAQRRAARRTSRSRTNLDGISCVSTSFCRAVGSHGTHALIETMGSRKSSS
jgi:hypothetical protein